MSTLAVTAILSAATVLLRAQDAPAEPPAAVPFPEHWELKDVKFRLGRGGCMPPGPCPGYAATILGDGTIQFDGRAQVLIPGKYTAHIDPETVRALVEEARKADFFSAPPGFAGGMDADSRGIALTIGGQSKVIDGFGLSPALETLILDVDKVFARWVKGDERTGPWLAETHWPMAAKTEDNLRIYAAMVLQRRKSTIDQYIAAGAPIASADGTQISPVCIASTQGDFDLVRRMVKSVEPAQPPVKPALLPAAVLRECLGAASSSGSLPVFDFWLDLGATAEGPNPEPDYRYWEAWLVLRTFGHLSPWTISEDVVCNGFLSGHAQMARKMLDYTRDLGPALRCAIGSTGPDRVDGVRTLLVAGAPVTAELLRNAAGLMAKGRLDIVRLLIDHASEANTKVSYNEALNTAIENGGTDAAEIVRLLLAAGADPNVATFVPGPSALFNAACLPPEPEKQEHEGHWDWTGFNNEETYFVPVCAPEVVEPLLAYGLQINAVNADGYTALMYFACSEGMTRELLADGADPKLAAKDGTTALQIAQRYNCPAGAALLEAAMKTTKPAPKL